MAGKYDYDGGENEVREENYSRFYSLALLCNTEVKSEAGQVTSMFCTSVPHGRIRRFPG
jgi:hypothetical protein